MSKPMNTIQTTSSKTLSDIAPKPYTQAMLRETWRRCLTGDDSSDPCDVAIAELSAYFHLSPEETRTRCINWEDDSLQEWSAKDRSTPEGLLEFYRTQVSWVFDTVWYHANQYHGATPAESVDVAFGLRDLPPGHHLDFGGGPGSTSLFFHALGWQVSLADISTTMLDFARWRLAKHGIPAAFYDPSQDALPPNTFDLITAFDVMVHVPDVGATLTRLWESLTPGGYLVFNIDHRPRTERTQWHLYAEQYPILQQVRAHGFRRCPKIEFFHVYQKIERSPANAQMIRLTDQMRYNGLVTAIGKAARRLKPGH